MNYSGSCRGMTTFTGFATTTRLQTDYSKSPQIISQHYVLHTETLKTISVWTSHLRFVCDSRLTLPAVIRPECIIGIDSTDDNCRVATLVYIFPISLAIFFLSLTGQMSA